MLSLVLPLDFQSFQPTWFNSSQGKESVSSFSFTAVAVLIVNIREYNSFFHASFFPPFLFDIFCVFFCQNSELQTLKFSIRDFVLILNLFVRFIIALPLDVVVVVIIVVLLLSVLLVLLSISPRSVK